MDHSAPNLELRDACIQLARELVEVLKKERECLITFNTDGLLENNFQKNQKLGRLQTLRGEWRAQLERLALDPTGEEEQLRPWLQAWAGLRDEAQLNQRFLKHSLRNMDLLAENFHRLLGLHTLYTPKGTRTEVKTSGKVVEGRY